MTRLVGRDTRIWPTNKNASGTSFTYGVTGRRCTVHREQFDVIQLGAGTMTSAKNNNYDVRLTDK